jgi:preprotein translocase subunit YajC
MQGRMTSRLKSTDVLERIAALGQNSFDLRTHTFESGKFAIEERYQAAWMRGAMLDIYFHMEGTVDDLPEGGTQVIYSITGDTGGLWMTMIVPVIAFILIFFYVGNMGETADVPLEIVLPIFLAPMLLYFYFLYRRYRSNMVELRAMLEQLLECV